MRPFSPRTVRFKTVLKMLEQRLNLTKESLIAEKETIKAIIRVVLWIGAITDRRRE